MKNGKENAYRKRGWGMLTVFFCTCLIGIVMCFFENARDPGIAVLVFAAIFYLPIFLFYRRLTPAQFEARLKAERAVNDERNRQIGGRTASIAVLVIMVSLAIGMVIGLMIEDRSVVYANFGQFAVLSVSILIINMILKKKM